MSTRFDGALEAITRVRGVQGAMLVGEEDGLVVAEYSMEGVRGGAVAALASSLAKRLRRASEAAAAGRFQFAHLQASQGALLVIPAPRGLLLVVVAARDVNVGLVRLEMRRAAEAVA